jgi:lipopolysaccharide transport system ATP-binding protein
MTHQRLLSLKGVGKSYRDWGNEIRRFLSWFGLPLIPLHEYWALQNINIEISPGESVGIVGQNGAGKSTLLKMIAGVLDSTVGLIEKQGRIGAVLELGLGFHPDLSGRENSLHSLALLGFSKIEIKALISEVESFAEIGEAFELPLRTYSSGMQMRVAFAVVTAYRPDLLIIDEALSVGDAYFQHKSFERIRKFKNAGTSLLFVSHGLQEVRLLCDRVLLLEEGKLLKDGSPEEVLDFYNALIADRSSKTAILQHKDEQGFVHTRSGSREAELVEVLMVEESGKQVEKVFVGQRLKLKLSIFTNEDVSELVVGMLIRNSLGVEVFGTNSHFLDKKLISLSAGKKISMQFNFTANLGPGNYSVA